MQSGIVLMSQYRSIMLSASLLTILILALSISASPVEIRNSLITLPIARSLNTSNGTINISQQDDARMDALMSRFASPLDRRDFVVPILNGGYTYTVTVVIGSLNTNCKFNLEREIAAADGLSYTDKLVIDTGTGNTWIGAQKEYVQTSTSINLNQPVRINYGSAVISGNEYSDTVIFPGGDIRITEQWIGVSPDRMRPSVRGADGIIGVGPVALTR